MNKYHKYKLLIFLIIIINIKNFDEIGNGQKSNFPQLYSINNFLMNNFTVNKNSALILETYRYHYECTPGFSKYFIDLGYTVDIVMHNMGKTTFHFFKPKKKIRLFIYEDIDFIKKNSDFFSFIIKKYKYVLIETTQPDNYNLYQKFNFNQTIFIFHLLHCINAFPLNIIIKFKIACLGNFPNKKMINPHYFGDLKLKKKNRITTFFITSTIFRSYKSLIFAAEQIKNENKKFRVIVIGKEKTFSQNDLPKKLKTNFNFKYNVTYLELYRDVYKSDFIIINLDPSLKVDAQFTRNRVTGSAQLSYGLLKPVLIHKHFSDFYNFNSSNSIIFDNFNFIDAMRDAINIDNKNYKKMQENLSLLEKEIYLKSLLNLKTMLN